MSSISKRSTPRLYFELARLHKWPAGSMLLSWPFVWALTMAARTVHLQPEQVLVQSVTYFIGSTLLHNAACILSDICDKDFDRQVERTKNRPIASGEISVPAAIVFLMAHLVVCVYMLTFTNALAFQVGLFGIFPLQGLYPLMKRWTNWPQAYLGVAMNWGFPVAWVAVTGSLDEKLLSTFLGGLVCWSIVYDSIYACQDKKDDVKAGVKSTALLFGENIRPILSVFAATFIGCLVQSGLLNGQGLAYYVLAVGGAATHMMWQLTTVDFDDPADCERKFKSNGTVGLLLWAGMFTDYLVEYYQYL